MQEQYGGMDVEAGQFYTKGEFLDNQAAIDAGKGGLELDQLRTEDEKVAAAEQKIAAEQEQERMKNMSPEEIEAERMKEMQQKAMPVFVTNWPGQMNDTSGRIFGGSISGGKITNYGTGDIDMYGQQAGGNVD